MARNLAYYIDPEEEERQKALIAEAFGPPPPPNLGVAPAPRVPITAEDIEAARMRAEVPAPEAGPGRDVTAEYARWASDPKNLKDIEEADPDPGASETEEDQEAPVAGERVRPAERSALDALVEPGAVQKLAPGMLGQQMPLTDAQKAAVRQGDLDVLLAPDKAANPFEEAAQAASAAKLAAGPEAVDKTAASVANEQKGVPAEPLLGKRTDVAGEALMSEPPATERNYGSEAARMTGSPQKGERSDLFGFDDEEGFSRQKRIDRVRELYDEEQEPSHHWEEELLKERGDGRLSDAQIRRRAAAIGFFQGAFSGDMGAGERWASAQHAANRDFYAARDKARDKDAANQRISRGMAEAIAASGQMSPEAAVKLRRNDDAVRNFGQFASQGGRAEGQGIGLSKEKLKLIAKMVESGDKAEAAKGLAMLRAATQLDVAEIYANKGKPTTPEEKAVTDNAAAAIMGQALGLDPAAGARALAGDYAGLSKEKAALAARLAPQILAKAGQPKGLDQVLNDSIKTQATQPIKDAYSIDKTIELAKNNREHRRKFKTDWNDASIAFKEAWQGWKSLSPAGQEALAEWAAGGWTGKIRSFLMEPGDQERIAAVQGVINALVKDRSGSAVTGSEWERLATEIGLTADDWNPFNSPSAIEHFLKISGDKLTSHRRVFEQEYGWDPREVGGSGR